MEFRKATLAATVALNCAIAHAGLDVHMGKVEYLGNPEGLDSRHPRFSWSLSSDTRGCRQGAYQILVAGSEEKLRADQGDLWDSGRVASDQSSQVSYGGKALESGGRYYWKARVWDQAGRVSGYGVPQSFSMGLLEPADWKGKWITGGNLCRKPFVVNKPLKRAQVFIAGLGYYELHLNGAKVGDHVLDPLWTEYTRTVRYVTYDVSDRVGPGANALGVMLGNGHFTGTRHQRGTRLLLQMRLDFADGTTTNVVSDESWKTAAGPVVENHVFNGETYDARLEREGWDRAEYDDKEWMQATVKEGPGGQLVAQACQPIKVIETMAPKTMSNPRPGVFVCDFGQNFAGWVRLRVRGARGDKVVLRFAEDLGKDGMIDPTTNRSAKNTDTYILKGGGADEVWEPRFTYHGFRYVEITGFPGTPQLGNLQGRVVHNAVDEIGEFACSNELINRIHRAMRWGMRSNLYGVLTDCPQREERAGWLECGHLLADSLMFNFELGAFYTKWIRDMADAQNDEGSLPPEVPYCGWAGWPGDPAWASSMVICPWSLYRQYEDTRILETYYDNMRRWVEFLGTRADNHIVKYNVFGDWANPSVEGTPGELISTAYYYLCINILEESSRLLGNQEAARKYGALAQDVKRAFNREFLYGFPAQPLRFAGASTSLPPAGKNNVESLLDQDAKTYFWSCRSPKPGDHITVDLGAAKSIKRIMASFRGGDFFQQGLLQSSLDGVRWSEIGRIDANFMNQGLKPTPMRYIRLLATKDQTSWICLLDLTVLEAGDEGKADHYQYVNGSQGCSAFPLALGLVPEAHKGGIVQALVNNVVNVHQGHLGIGEVGLKYLLESLTENGRADVVYGMVTKTNAPSWGDRLAKGHTTLVEMWDGSGSHNHIMWGTIEAWFYEALAGINRDSAIPGYKRIVIKPCVVGDLTWAKGSVKTVYGVVASAWEKRGDALTMTVAIPANATAEIHVPKLGMKHVLIRESGKALWHDGEWIKSAQGITDAKDGAEYVRLEAGSGTYRFDIQGDGANSATELAEHPGSAEDRATRTKGVLRIMCVGDSITVGYTDNPQWNVPFEFGYRSPLYQRLVNAGYAVQFVGESPEPWNGISGKPRNTPSLDLRTIGQDHHRGYGGCGTAGLLNNISPWVSADKPDVVLLMIGINDGGSPAARTNIERIVHSIMETKPDTYVIVAEITPVAHFTQTIADYNAFIRDGIPAAFRTVGKHVRTVNQYTNLFTGGAIDPGLLSNGINHPNAMAYDRMAQTWFDAISEIWLPPVGTEQELTEPFSGLDPKAKGRTL